MVSRCGMPGSEDRLLQRLDEYIRRYGGDYSRWFVGAAANPERKMFGEHNVKDGEDPWIYHCAGNFTEAKRALAALIDGRGADGTAQELPGSCLYVYAYMKKRHTDP